MIGCDIDVCKPTHTLYERTAHAVIVIQQSWRIADGRYRKSLRHPYLGRIQASIRTEPQIAAPPCVFTSQRECSNQLVPCVNKSYECDHQPTSVGCAHQRLTLLAVPLGIQLQLGCPCELSFAKRRKRSPGADGAGKGVLLVLRGWTSLVRYDTARRTTMDKGLVWAVESSTLNNILCSDATCGVIDLDVSPGVRLLCRARDQPSANPINHSTRHHP